MSATLSTLVRPAAPRWTRALLRLLGTGMDGLAGYFVRRAAVTSLHELDDRALRDIGLTRSQIEAAVHGLVRLDRGRM